MTDAASLAAPGKRWIERGRLALGLLRGGADRHRAAARLRALSRRVTWRKWRSRVSARPLIIVSLLEHMGDIVAAEPITRYLRRSHPDAVLAWAVRPSYAPLLSNNPHVDAVLHVGCVGEWLHLCDHRLFSGERVLDLHISGRDCKPCGRTLIRSAAGSLDLNNYYFHGNLLHVYCRMAGLPPLDDTPRVYIDPAAARSVDRRRLPRDFVVVHCRSNQIERDWTSPKWRQLIARMTAAGMRVVEVGLNPVASPGELRTIDLCGKISVLETAEVIRRASLFVGIDSGPAHLANAVGTPGVILLGHYGPFHRYMPYSGRYADPAHAAVIQHHAPAADIPLDLVEQAVFTAVRGQRVCQP